MRIHLNFDQEKAVQVAARLLKLSGQPSMDKLKLVKLLYLVDREAFAEKGRPVIGGLYVSMPHGPVTSEVLDSMNFGVVAGWTIWDDHFDSDGAHQIWLKKELSVDALSGRDLKIVETVFKKFGGMEPFALREYTHTLPEWEDPNGSSIEIPVDRMIVATGRSWEEAKRITQELDAVQFLTSAMVQ